MNNNSILMNFYPFFSCFALQYLLNLPQIISNFITELKLYTRLNIVHRKYYVLVKFSRTTKLKKYICTALCTIVPCTMCQIERTSSFNLYTLQIFPPTTNIKKPQPVYVQPSNDTTKIIRPLTTHLPTKYITPVALLICIEYGSQSGREVNVNRMYTAYISQRFLVKPLVPR